MIFEKLVELLVELDERLIFKLHSGFCESSLGDHAFRSIRSAEGIEKAIQLFLVGASYQAEKKNDQ